MKKKTTAVCAAGTGASLACCFGLLGFLLGIFGLTSAIAYVNTYGDFIFFPSYAVFGTIFIYGLVTWRRMWYTYMLSVVTAAVMLYFSTFGIVYAALIFGGVVVGLLLIKYVLRRS